MTLQEIHDQTRQAKEAFRDAEWNFKVAKLARQILYMFISTRQYTHAFPPPPAKLSEEPGIGRYSTLRTQTFHAEPPHLYSQARLIAQKLEPTE